MISALRIHDEVTRLVDAIGQGGSSGASTWEQLTNKPFNTLNSDDFEVDNGELKIKLDGANVETTELARTNSTALVQFTVPNLSQYDFIQIVLYNSTDIATLPHNICANIVPYSLFATPNYLLIAQWGTTIQGRCDYINDTTIKVLCNNNTRLSVVYGVKIKALSSGGSGDLPIASSDTLGAVKVGEGLSITEDGTLSSSGGSSSHDYSAEEKVIGSWINGKPIYEISGEYISSGNANEQTIRTDINTTIIDKLIKIEGCVNNAPTNVSFPNNYYNQYNYNSQFYIDNVGVKTRNNSRNIDGHTITYTLQYTKLSD